MTFAQGFFDYFRACPLLDSKKLNFDYHDANVGESFLDTSMPDNKIKSYMSGSSIWEKPIYFCTVGSFGKDARIQIANKVEFEEFREWVEHQNLNKKFPILPENCHAISLECTTDGTAFNQDENIAQYQIQMILTYQRNIRR